MADLTEIVEKKEKPVLKSIFSIIGSIFLIDFVMFVCNKYTNKYPYLTNIIVLSLVVISCSLIIIKFFSKYLYVLNKDELLFHRLVGKRAFEMLRIDLENLLYIKPYNKENNIKKYSYKFLFDKEYEDAYVGKFKKDATYHYFLFKPSKKMVNAINKKIKKKE